MARTRPSAPSRSSTPSKNTTELPFITRYSRTVIDLPCHGDASGTCNVNSAPGTNLRSGLSVYSSSLSAPLSPCALTRRPTRSWFLPWPVATTSVVRDVNADALPICQGGDERAQRPCGAAAAPDHASTVVGVHAHLEQIASRRGGSVDTDIIRMIDDPLDDVFERGGEHGDYSASAAGASADSASAAAGASSAGASAFFSTLGLTTDFFEASISKGALGSATWTVDFASLSPLNLPQSPVSLRRAATWS